MAIFLDLAEHRKTIASRSTNVTFARSMEVVCDDSPSAASRRSSSGTYSFVNWPHSRTLNDLSSSRVGLIFSTVLTRYRICSCMFRTTTFMKVWPGIDAC
jgi:hypothetical protein